MVVYTGLDRIDLRRILEIERRSFSSPWRAADFRQVLRDPAALHLGIELEGRLIGYGIAYVEAPVLHLANLAIDPVFRRRGWARHLLGEIFSRAVERGCLNCDLEVRASNEAGLALYRSCGFTQVAVRPGYYRKPRENALILQAAIENF